ncbi:MAG TPA: RluA family pseudouridine synthase [Verrucomicrobiae bacterium]|nr:RluA family pseudouridine synthase [Verrucomicrobiae bacterium]
MKRVTVEAGPADAGRTLQALLHDRLSVSHAQARGLIDAGSVRSAAPPAVRSGDYARRLRPGDRFEVAWEEGRRYHAKPVERPGRGYDILHRDDALIVIDKGPEVLSVPTHLRSEDSLLDRLLENERGRGVRNAQVFPVHRLDRDTSGLLLFARTGPALGALKEQFADRSLERRYVAVVEGTVEEEKGRFESRVVESPRDLKVRSTRRPDRGREAITEYEVAERLPNATVVNVRLRTGRKNQIRVHFAEAGHPLVGDHRYGRPSYHIRRTALHALRLAFIHPLTNQRVSFESPLPEDISTLIRRLRSEAKGPEPERPGSKRG